MVGPVARIIQWEPRTMMIYEAWANEKDEQLAPKVIDELQGCAYRKAAHRGVNGFSNPDPIPKSFGHVKVFLFGFH